MGGRLTVDYDSMACLMYILSTGFLKMFCLSSDCTQYFRTLFLFNVCKLNHGVLKVLLLAFVHTFTQWDQLIIKWKIEMNEILIIYNLTY